MPGKYLVHTLTSVLNFFSSLLIHRPHLSLPMPCAALHSFRTASVKLFSDQDVSSHGTLLVYSVI